MSNKQRGHGQTKGERREGRKSQRNHFHPPSLPGDHLTRPRQQRNRKPFTPKTDTQERYANAIEVYDLVFCRGPMGTGKTYVPAALAAEAFEDKLISKIIITRPCVGAEEEYGFLPGDLHEKTAPWAKPVLDVLTEKLGAGAVEYLVESGQIEIAPLGMLRGATFKDCFVLFDEAQNATIGQMKLFLTRIGENAKVIVDGDPDEQLDIPASESGFNDAWDRMQGHPQIGFVTFDVDDIVRSGLARDILLRYREKKGASVGHAELGTILDRSFIPESVRH
jgi:phosphate starvation-inducible protein PhoH and related proteins